MDIAPDNIILGRDFADLNIMRLIGSFVMFKHVINKRPIFGIYYFAKISCAVVAHDLIFGLLHHHGDIARRHKQSILVAVIMNLCKNCVIAELLDSVNESLAFVNRH